MFARQALRIVRQQASHQADPDLLVRDVQLIQTAETGIALDRDIAALIQQRRDARHPFRRRIEVGRHTFPISYLLRDHMVLTQHLDQVSERTATEPVRVDTAIRQGRSASRTDCIYQGDGHAK